MGGDAGGHRLDFGFAVHATGNVDRVSALVPHALGLAGLDRSVLYRHGGNCQTCFLPLGAGIVSNKLTYLMEMVPLDIALNTFLYEG